MFNKSFNSLFCFIFLNIKVKLYLNINKNSYNCLKFKQTNYKPINFLGVNVC